MKSLKLDLDSSAFEQIFTIFSQLEFFWNIKKNSKRSYFFNKGCVLQFCLDRIGIELEVHTLKDKLRVEQQMTEMHNLL